MNARSWAESVRLTQDEKLVRNAPPRVAYVEAARRVTPRYHPGRESKLDPILGLKKVPDSPHDEAHRARTAVLGLNRARDLQALVETTYDVITQKPRLRENVAPPSVRQHGSVCSSAPFNILQPSEVLPEAQLSDAARRHRDPRPLTSYHASRARRRAVDPITNKHLVDDDARVERDRETARDKALLRYWQSRNLDPLTMTYVDPAKEDAYQAGVEASKATQGTAQRARRPPSLATSLGACYDIVCHRPKDADVLDLVDTMDGRKLRRFTSWDVEAKQSGAGEEAEVRDGRRALSRAAQRRYEENVDPHGFDILTGSTRDGGVLEGTWAGVKTRAWDRITADMSGAAGGDRGNGKGARAESAPAGMSRTAGRSSLIG